MTYTYGGKEYTASELIDVRESEIKMDTEVKKIWDTIKNSKLDDSLKLGILCRFGPDYQCDTVTLDAVVFDGAIICDMDSCLEFLNEHSLEDDDKGIEELRNNFKNSLPNFLYRFITEDDFKLF